MADQSLATSRVARDRAATETLQSTRILRLVPVPDPDGAGYEWRRETLAEHHAEPLCLPPAASGPQPLQEAFRPPAAKPRCDGCGYLAARCACLGGAR